MTATDTLLPSAHAARAPHIVVGIGASAGGLNALEQLFPHLPVSSDYAFVVVTHLSPEFKSLLDELLARHTEMPVHIVADGAPIRGGAVYVLPPMKEMIVVADHLVLSDRDPRETPHVPIDTFFRSLAREWGPRAAGIILSGSGSDGSRGVNDIKKSGGLVFVQSPTSARFTGMPEAAIQTGCVDQVLEPDRIGAALAAIPSVRPGAPNVGASARPTPRDAADRILTAIFGESDIDFSSYKTSTFERRIQRRMLSMGVESVDAYADIVSSDPAEARRLADDLLIGVTEFFRDPQAFERLGELVLANAIPNKAKGATPVRIWAPGCSTGQEAYSLAILAREIGRAQNVPLRLQLFATDIHDPHLGIASKGVYKNEAMINMPPHIIENYFNVIDRNYAILPEIRRDIVFAHHNVLSDPPFTKIDLIVCRNLLIYLDSAAQQRLFSMFHFALDVGGALFLGPSESLGETESDFDCLDARWRIYQKRSDRAVRPLLPSPQSPAHLARRSPAGVATRSSSGRKPADLVPAYNALLEEYAPAGALITTARELLHTFGNVRRFLQAPSGMANLDIANMVDDAMRTPLAAGIERCLRERAEVVFPALPLRDGSEDVRVRLRVKPLVENANGSVSHLFVSLEHVDVAAETTPVIELSGSDVSRDRVADLEIELKRTKETLQATIEELETSNEELQSANEELMASNQELQSTNEELNSVNEELYTVNAEHQNQNVELISLNADIESLMKVVNFGVIFLDDRLTIRRFTSAANVLFNIISDDIGRSISHITHRLTDFDVTPFVGRALSAGDVIERQCLSDRGEWWLLRCAPHEFSGGGRGAVLTAQSIDELKSAQLSAAQGEQRYRHIAELTHAVYVDAAASGKILEEQPGWASFTGQSFHDYADEPWFSAVHEDDAHRINAEWASALGLRQEFNSTFRLRQQNGWRHVRATARPRLSDVGEVSGWSIVVLDVEDAVQADVIVRESEEYLKAVMASNPCSVTYVGPDRRIRFVSTMFERETNRPAAEIVGSMFADHFSGEHAATYEHMAGQAFAGERTERMLTQSLPQGRQKLFHVICQPHRASNGDILGFVLNRQEVSHLKEEVDERGRFARFLAETFDELGNELFVIAPSSMTIRHASRKARQKLGYSLEELRSMRITDLTPGLDHAKWSTLMQQARSDASDQGVVQSFFLTRSGETYDCEVQAHIAHDGAEEQLVVWAVDISDRLSVARALRERTAELAASNRDLEQFATVASHDLRAPLRHIVHFAALCHQKYADALPPDGRETLSILISSAARLQNMVSSLLEYSRLGRSGEKFENVDLNAIAAAAKEDVRLDLEAAGGEIILGPLPVVDGYPELLTRLFQNLFANSIRYRSAHPLTVTVAASRRGSVHRIHVEDNGQGVDPKFAEHIFEIFRRLQPSDDSEGVGIGLSLCRRIAELHGGRLWLDESFRHGARFTLELAADDAPTE